MNNERLLVIGAAGDVGQGIVSAALTSGRRVVAAGRDRNKLARIAALHAGKPLEYVVGDIATEAGAAALWQESATRFGEVDAVVVSVNAPTRPQPLMESSAASLAQMLASNLLPHFIAAKAFIPRLAQTGLLIGIGGGTADFIIPGLSHISVCQAAERMLYRGLWRERQAGAEVRELMISSMVNGVSNRDRAKPQWLTDIEVGRHVCAILDAPGQFPDPVIQLRSREDVGRPQVHA